MTTLPRLCAGDDFTVYISKSDIIKDTGFIHDEETRQNVIRQLKDGNAFSEQLTLKDGRISRTGRALACYCFHEEFVSITLRTDEVKEIALSHGTINSPSANTPGNAAAQQEDAWASSSFQAGNEQHRHGYKLIFEQLLQDKFSPQGIVIVSGGTGSGKTTVVRGIIDLYLKQLVGHVDEVLVPPAPRPQVPKLPRRPHFVTYEDPIEVLMFGSPEKALNAGIDYTPREKGKGVSSLRSALVDALRQTPSLYYIAEIRDDREWKPVINFAGTGHLVIATTHAGSVTECMKKVFRAFDVRTAADRNHVAEKIIGIVHLHPYYPNLAEVKPEERKHLPAKWVLPSLWRNSEHGVSGIVSDGLASILPYNPQEGSNHYSSIGRRWFARELLKRTLEKDGLDPNLYDLVSKVLDTHAVQMDMRGM